MSARIIDGRALARNVREKLASQIEGLHARDTAVRLDAILVGSDGGATVYADNQARACRELGIEHVLHELPDNSGDKEIAGRVMDLNADPLVHAIMVHLPLPAGVDTDASNWRASLVLCSSMRRLRRLRARPTCSSPSG